MGFADKAWVLLTPYEDAILVDVYDYHHGFLDRVYLRSQNFVSRWRKQIIAVSALNAAIFALVLLIFMVQYADDGSNLDTSGLQFALFKNTLYGSCDNYTTPVTPCRAENTIQSSAGVVLWWDGVISGPDEFCSCFAGMAVVPSTPRHSAFGYNGLFNWLTQTVTFATGLWALLDLFLAKGEDGPGDSKIGKLFWVLLAYDVIQFFMWWGGFIALAHSPAYESPVALLSWITPWRYLYALTGPRLSEHTGSWAFILASLAALAQWIASAAAVGITKTAGLAAVQADPSFVRYDFAAQFWNASTAQTQCSADEIANITALFTGPTSGSGQYNPRNANGVYVASFAINSLAAVVATYFLVRALSRDGQRSIKGFGLTLLSLGVLVYITMALSISPTSQAVSTVLAHEPCNLVHITMSANKAYMDVSGYAKGWRAVKGWFNV